MEIEEENMLKKILSPISSKYENDSYRIYIYMFYSFSVYFIYALYSIYDPSIFIIISSLLNRINIFILKNIIIY